MCKMRLNHKDLVSMKKRRQRTSYPEEFGPISTQRVVPRVIYIHPTVVPPSHPETPV